MTLFAGYPTYNWLRVLYYTRSASDPSAALLNGEDVFALQTLLNEAGFKNNVGQALVADGVLGQNTSQAISNAQKALGLTVDGKCGALTWRAVAMFVATPLEGKYGLPKDALKGQLQTESGYYGGAYSPQYSNGSWDEGETQRNTSIYTDHQANFDGKVSIDSLAAAVKKYYGLFAGTTTGTHRRWQLAQGAWNAPAYASWIAWEEGANVSSANRAQPSAASRQKLEDYMKSASAYY